MAIPSDNMAFNRHNMAQTQKNLALATHLLTLEMI